MADHYEGTKAEERSEIANEPFNEAMKHQDIVSGFPQKRSIDEFPKALRPMVKWFALLLLIILGASLIYTLWSYL